MPPKDRGGGKPARNPRTTGRAGKGPGSSKSNEHHTTTPFGRNWKNPPKDPGPGNKGGKPPKR